MVRHPQLRLRISRSCPVSLRSGDPVSSVLAQLGVVTCRDVDPATRFALGGGATLPVGGGKRSHPNVTRVPLCCLHTCHSNVTCESPRCHSDVARTSLGCHTSIYTGPPPVSTCHHGHWCQEAARGENGPVVIQLSSVCRLLLLTAWRSTQWIVPRRAWA